MPRKKNPHHNPDRKRPAGAIIRRGGKDGPQVVRSAGGKRWTDEARDIFLDALGNGSTYTAAAEASGFSRSMICRRRRLDPVFAAQCDEARAHGVARIDQLLIKEAEDALEGRPRNPDSPLPPMTIGDAIAIVRMHHARADPGGRRRYGAWQPRPRTLDEVRNSILTKLSAIARARGQI
jgi:hypothetical protein